MLFGIAGQPLHSRALNVTVSIAADAAWQVRGDIIDLRKCSFVPMLGDLQPAGVIHNMSISLVLDPDSRRMTGIRVDQPHVAVEASTESRGECCRDPAPRLEEMSGEVLDDGFVRRLNAGFGGALGCSHLLTLFQMMGHCLPAALERETRARAADGAVRATGERPFRRSVFVDGIEADGGAIALLAQLGDVETRPASQVDTALSRLAREHAIRIEVGIDDRTRALTGLRAAERVRDHTTLTSAEWSDLAGELESLVGAPIVPGLARRVLDLLGERPERAPVQDLLLQLAPGYIQVLAAVSERFFAPARPAKDSAGKAGEKSGEPPAGMLGGMTDSCYMWRAGGPLQSVRSGASNTED